MRVLWNFIVLFIINLFVAEYRLVQVFWMKYWIVFFTIFELFVK